MKFFDAAFAEPGVGRADGKVGGARFGQGKGVEGGEAADGAGFAEIMAALTGMPSEALPVSLEQLAQMVRQAGEGAGSPAMARQDANGAGPPLMALLHAHGRGADQILRALLTEGGQAGHLKREWPAVVDLRAALADAAAQLSDEADGSPAAEGKRLAENLDFQTAQRGQDRAAANAAMVRGGAVQEGAQRVPGEKEPADKALQAKAAAEKVAAETPRAGELPAADRISQGRAAGTVGERDEKLAAALRQASPQALGVDDRDGGRPGSGGDEDRTGRGRDAATRGGILFQKGEGKSAVPEPFGPMTGQDAAQSRSASAATGPSNEAPGGSEPRPASTELGHTAKADNGPEPQPLPRNVQSDVMRQIVQRMTLHTEGRQAMMQIQLKPEMLGQLRMQIVTENQQVTIRIAAENTQVKQLIEQNMHVLRNELQQQGLQIQKVDVVVPQDPQQDPWQNPQDTAFRHQRQRQGRQGGSRQAAGRDSSGPAAAAGEVGDGAARSGRMVGANGEVDFFA